MHLPGLKPRRRLTSGDSSQRDYSKLGWYVMAVIALAWLAYSLWAAR